MITEVIRPGALTDALRKSDVRCLFNHDPNHVLGRTKSGTLRLIDTAQGLDIECDPPETQTARDLLELLGRKDVDQMSFAFTILEDRWTFSRDPGKPDFREILKIEELYDVSPVTYPAYPQTEVWARTSQENQQVLRAARMRSGRTDKVLIQYGRPRSEEDEERDLVVENDTQAGYLIAPQQMAAGMIRAVDDNVVIRQYATVMPLTQAKSLGAISLDADPEDGEWTPECKSVFMPNTFTSGKYVGLFGDLSYYWIAESLAMRFQRSIEKYIEEDKTLIIVRAMLDGMPALAEAFTRIKLG